MRAREFITEEFGKPSKRQHYSSVGLNLFADANYDRLYILNRIMMAVASTDGTYLPKIEDESWAAKTNTAHPYTKADQDKLKQAYKAVGIDYTDPNKGDLKSHELDSTNKVSPVKPFKGY